LLICFKCRFNVQRTVNYYKVDVMVAFIGDDIQIYIAKWYHLSLKTVIHYYTRSLTRHLLSDNLSNFRTEKRNKEVP